MTTKTRQPADELTEIVIVIDESGSMGGMQKDVCGGFNTFVEDQKKNPGRANLTLVKFSGRGNVKVVYEKAIGDVPILGDDYNPGGGTALFDAIGLAIKNLKEKILKLDANDKPDKVIIVIMTDGDENESREETKVSILEKIEECKLQGGWEFVYIGANQDAFAVGGSLGISNNMNYQATGQGTRSAYQMMSKGVTSYRTTGNLSLDPNQTP